MGKFLMLSRIGGVLIQSVKNPIISYNVSRCIWRLYSTQKNFQRDNPHCNIGTIGHHHHGKTTLTAAITKVLFDKQLAKLRKIEDIDFAPQEKSKGLSLNVTYIDYCSSKRHYIHADCPGHEDYIKNTITGISQMDCAILTVSACDGSMAQTKEHLLIAKQMGINHIAVFINKIDIADAEMPQLVEMEIQDLLTSLGYDSKNTPFVSGSALCALEGKNPAIGSDAIWKLLDALDKHVPVPKKDNQKSFLLPIKSVYLITDRGTIATGKLEKGSIKKGDKCEIIGYQNSVEATITAVEMFHEILEEAQIGDQVDVFLRGVKKDDIKRGMFLCTPGTVKAWDSCEAKVQVPVNENEASNKPLRQMKTVQVYSKTWDCTAGLDVIEKEEIAPGETGRVNLQFLKPMAMTEGQSIVLRNGHNTIGMGTVSKMQPTKT